MRGKNIVSLIGNLAAAPEARGTAGRSSLVVFRIAVNEPYKKNGEWVDSTEYINVKCWGDGLCDFIMANISKGDAVLVDGKLRTESFEKNGVKHYPTFVVVNGFDGTRVDLVSRPDARRERATPQGGRDADQAQQRQSPPPQQPSKPPSQDDYLDDEIPF